MQQWQPIETAPQDGTDILICDMTASEPSADIAHRHEGYWVGCSSFTRSGLHSNYDLTPLDIGVFPTATHWMPLPALPGSVSEPGKDTP